MMTQTPDERVIVIDAKASDSPYSVTMAGLRPLIEYVQVQTRRQRGHNAVGAALIVAREFEQPADRLQSTADEFLAETGVPVALLTVDVLIGMVQRLAEVPHLRNGVRWGRIFCQPRLIPLNALLQEVEAAQSERVSRSAVDAARAVPLESSEDG